MIYIRWILYGLYADIQIASTVKASEELQWRDNKVYRMQIYYAAIVAIKSALVMKIISPLLFRFSRKVLLLLSLLLSHTQHWSCYCFCYCTFSHFHLYKHADTSRNLCPLCEQAAMQADNNTIRLFTNYHVCIFFLVRTHISPCILMQFNALLVIFMLVYELIIQVKWRWSGRVRWPQCQA